MKRLGVFLFVVIVIFPLFMFTQNQDFDLRGEWVNAYGDRIIISNQMEYKFISSKDTMASGLVSRCKQYEGREVYCLHGFVSPVDWRYVGVSGEDRAYVSMDVLLEVNRSLLFGEENLATFDVVEMSYFQRVSCDR